MNGNVSCVEIFHDSLAKTYFPKCHIGSQSERKDVYLRASDLVLTQRSVQSLVLKKQVR